MDLMIGSETPTLRPARPVREPGPLTAGQRLVVISGIGLTQEWGKPVQVIRQGDVVWCPPRVKHWHGAAPTTAMTHIAVQEQLDGRAVDWMEKVSDELLIETARDNPQVPLPPTAVKRLKELQAKKTA